MVKKQMPQDQTAQHAMMALKRLQQETIVQNVLMGLSLTMLLIQIAPDVLVELKHYLIDPTAHCIIELTIGVPMALKLMLPEVTATDVYIP